MKSLFFDLVQKYLSKTNEKASPLFRPVIVGTQKFLLDNIQLSLPAEIRYDELHNLAPPYPEMWFEWHDADHDWAGVYVKTRRLISGEWEYGLYIFSEINGITGLYPISLVFSVPASGRYERGKGLDIKYYKDPYFVGLTDETAKILIADLNNTYIGMILFAISLMHCKNIIEVEKGGKNPNIKNRRHRSKGTKHYILDVVPVRNIKRTEYEQPGNGFSQRLHFRRGHFKEYTTDRPLFGKYVGTFWWEAHVAGNKDNGEIKKDYRILPTQQ